MAGRSLHLTHSTSTRRSRLGTTLAVLFAVSLVVSACGSGGSDSSDGSAGAPETSAASSSSGSAEGPASASSNEQTEPVKLRAMQANANSLTLPNVDFGNFLDIWGECEPTVEVENVVGEKVVEALAAGTVDFGSASPNRFVGAIHQGLEAKIIGAITPAWVQFLVVGPDASYKSFADMKGATFGISSFGSAGHYATIKMATNQGWSEDDIEIVPLGSLDGIIAGLKSGQIDGFLWSGQTAFLLEMNGEAKVLEKSTELVGPNAQNVIVATDDVIKREPAAVRAFAECAYKAVEYMQNNHDAARDILLNEWDYDPALADKMIEEELMGESTDGVITPEMLDGILEATHFTVDPDREITREELEGMYLYWGDIK